MEEAIDFKQAMFNFIKRCEEQYRNPPRQPPLLVPAWFPDVWVAEGHDLSELEELARDYGFDGYEKAESR